jgi:hypothetical protein
MSSKGIAFAAAVVGIGSWLTTAGAAHAIPANQAECSRTSQTITASTGFFPLSDLAVTVDNRSAPRTAIVHLSADVSVDPVAEARVAYSVDGSGPTSFGPANFANHQEFAETRSTIAVIPLQAGTHTVRPVWRVSGVAGKRATFVAGCVTVESSTR